MTTSFPLTILYAQIAVFEPHLENPFNEWSRRHYNQAFSWRLGCVSFRTLDEGGSAEVEVAYERSFVLSPQTTRAIGVPFRITGSRGVIIASIGDEQNTYVPPGEYSLIYEAFSASHEVIRIRLTFVEGPAAEPKILVADEGMHPEYPLLMEARPATLAF
jgi:hypothetical protein